MKLSLLLIPFSFACSNNPKNVSNPPLETAQYNIDSFLAKFKPLSTDTLKVYSAEDVENDTFKFKGQSLSHHDWQFIKSIYGKFANEYDSSDALLSQFFACYKFDINHQNIALIIRTPGEYVSSKIDLFMYNKLTKTVVHQLELAENWGDAGDIFESCSFLFGKENLQIYSYNYSGYDHSVEDINDTTFDETKTLYHIRINPYKIDTLTLDSNRLVKYWSKK